MFLPFLSEGNGAFDNGSATQISHLRTGCAQSSNATFLAVTINPSLPERTHRLLQITAAGQHRFKVGAPSRKKTGVGLSVSGEELVPPGQECPAGAIWESNSTLLKGLLEQLGYPCWDCRVVADQPQVLRNSIVELAGSCDVVVSTGGVSAGDSDWIRPLIGELGEVNFWKLFLKPGRPFAFGWVGDQVPFFGFPGNPVAAAITALQLLWPALRVHEGQPQPELELFPRLRMTLDAPYRRRPGRPELARASLLCSADGQLRARVDGSQASSRIGSLRNADLLLEIPVDSGPIEAGHELWALLLRRPIF